MAWKRARLANGDKDPPGQPFGEVVSGSAAGSISYFGIVDILTPYKLRKRCETLCCGTLLGCRDISCQPPDVYQHRFNQFMDRQVLAVSASAPAETVAVMPGGHRLCVAQQCGLRVADLSGQ